jgi:hypothetical protein
MQKWKYRSMVLRDLSIAESKLNAEGDKGWELVAVCLLESNTARVFFKMPDYGEDSPDAEFASDSALGGPSPFQS